MSACLILLSPSHGYLDCSVSATLVVLVLIYDFVLDPLLLWDPFAYVIKCCSLLHRLIRVAILVFSILCFWAIIYGCCIVCSSTNHVEF